MDPSTLSTVLNIPGCPETRPTFMTGYPTKLWGEYPALLAKAKPKTKMTVLQVRWFCCVFGYERMRGEAVASV